ncbi:MAG: glycosyltransferase family 4 protein [Chloroflexota bacterium]
MPLRIVMLTNFAQAPLAVHGGVEAVARTLAFALAATEDVEVHVVASQSDVRRAYIQQRAERLFVHFLPRLGRLELPTLFVHDRWQLGRVLRKLRPDVVHTHELGRYGFVCHSLGYPYALTVHGITSVEKQLLHPTGLAARGRHSLLRFVEQVTLRGAARIIANSTYVLGLVPRGIRDRAVRIPNPVDPVFFDLEPSSACSGRIGWVGRVSRLKGVDLLLRALPIVRQVVPNAHVRLVGPSDDDPRYLDELRELFTLAGPAGCVELMGQRHGAQLRHEYASMAVLAQPSRQDNVPMVIAEAMVVGRPVVASRVGGISDLVDDGATGVLCPPEDHEALAAGLIRIVVDPMTQARLGSAASAVARQRFDPRLIAAQHVQVYQDLASAVSRTGTL